MDYFFTDFDDCMYPRVEGFSKSVYDLWFEKNMLLTRYPSPEEGTKALLDNWKSGRAFFYDGVKPDDLFHAVHDAKVERRFFERFIPRCEETVAVFKQCVNAGLKPIVLTHSQTKYALHGLNHLGFLGTCVQEEDVWGLDRVGLSVDMLKNQQAVYQSMLAQYGISAEKAIMVEDSTENLYAPHKMGFKCMHVLNGKEHPQSTPYATYDTFKDVLLAI